MLFHEKLDLKLLRLVRANPVLYDYNNPMYMDFNAREVIWQKIGDELKRPSTACKVRWINIRDVYRRILKKNSEPGTQRPKVYKYESEVSFLRPYYKEVPASSVNDNFDDADDRTSETMEDFANDEHIKSDIDEEAQPVSKVVWSGKSSIKKKKKKQRYSEGEDPISTSSFNESNAPPELDPTDPVDAFLLSIGATLKTFSPYHLNIAKSKIFSVVQEHDLQQIVQKGQNNENNDIKIVSSEAMYMN